MSNFSRRDFLKLSSVSAAILALAGCAPDQKPDEGSEAGSAVAGKDELVIYTGQGMCSGGYDPCTGWGMYGYNFLHSALSRYTSDLEIVGDLATGFDVTDGGLTYTYHLRDGAKFCDGTDVKASDVVFTYLTAKDSGSSVDLTMLESAEAPDDATVVFKLNKPYSVFQQYGTQIGIVPEADYDEEYGLRGTGSGPFKVVQLDMDQQLILEPNEYYYGVQTPFKKITVLNLDSDTSLANAKSGELDLVFVNPQYSEEEVPGMTIKVLESVDKYGFNLPQIPSGTVDADGNAIGNDVTSDFAIRQALNIGLDRKTIIQNGLNGYGIPAYARVTGLPWCLDDPEFEDGRVDEAIKILEDAGWVEGADGIREKDGVKAEFNLMAFAGATDRYDLAVAVSEDAKKLGIKINAEQRSRDETSVLRWSQALMNASGSYTPAELVRYRTGGGNLSSYGNPAVDAHIEDALAAATPEEANAHWKLMQDDGECGISRDISDIWLVRLTQNYYVVDGLDISSSYCFAEGHGLSLANIEEWTYEA
ncbi:MAG: twin-arginine translocation signal domain-containing protein [Atopobiaceae bacterium]|nr:twin-arginine translocation signal domain-containing protein [Atopobiaceae bacterium]